MSQEIKCPNCESKPNYAAVDLSAHNHFYKLEVMQGTDEGDGINKMIIDKNMNVFKTNLKEKRPGRTREGELEIKVMFTCEHCGCLWANNLSFHKGLYFNERVLISEKDFFTPWSI